MNLTKSLFTWMRFNYSNFSGGKTKYPQRKYSNKEQVQPQEFIYGLNSVEAALHAGKRSFYELFISNSEVIQLNSKTMKLINFAKSSNLQLTYTQKQKLDRMSSNSPHQNVVLRCSKLPLNTIDNSQNHSFKQGIYVYTDKITDPQNFGAIIRSSLFFGVNHIFSGKKYHCPLNATVSKASTGAVQLMNVSLIQKSEQFMINWKQQGGCILSTEVNNEFQRLYSVQQLQQLKKQDKLDKILIILGSQGFGVSQHLKKHSDYNIIIERKGDSSYPYSLIDSLNVNAALTAILFELTKDIESKKSLV